MRHPPATKREAMLPAPIIEVRNAYDEIDLQELGDEDLVTYIHYEDIAEGDRLRILWRGATALGEELDSVDVEIEVESPNFDPVTKPRAIKVFFIGNTRWSVFESWSALVSNCRAHAG